MNQLANNIRRTLPTTVSIDAICQDFTEVDRQAVENEKKYYNLVVNFRKLRQKVDLSQKDLTVE